MMRLAFESRRDLLYVISLSLYLSSSSYSYYHSSCSKIYYMHIAYIS